MSPPILGSPCLRDTATLPPSAIFLFLCLFHSVTVQTFSVSCGPSPFLLVFVITTLICDFLPEVTRHLLDILEWKLLVGMTKVTQFGEPLCHQIPVSKPYWMTESLGFRAWLYSYSKPLGTLWKTVVFPLCVQRAIAANAAIAASAFPLQMAFPSLASIWAPLCCALQSQNPGFVIARCLWWLKTCCLCALSEQFLISPPYTLLSS